MINFWTDEGEEDSEEAGPSKKEEQTQESGQAEVQNNCQSEASPSSGGEKRAEKESSSEPDRGSSTDDGQSACGSTDTNSQDATVGDQRAGVEPSGKEEEDEEEEEQAASCAQANKRLPGRRRYTERQKKALFTIHAVNSNGTTERGMGEADGGMSFSCEYILMRNTIYYWHFWFFCITSGSCAHRRGSRQIIIACLLSLRLLNSHLFIVMVSFNSRVFISINVPALNGMTHCFGLAQPYISIDWDPDMKKKYYSENEAEVRSLMNSLILKIAFLLLLH